MKIIPLRTRVDFVTLGTNMDLAALRVVITEKVFVVAFGCTIVTLSHDSGVLRRVCGRGLSGQRLGRLLCFLMC